METSRKKEMATDAQTVRAHKNVWMCRVATSFACFRLLRLPRRCRLQCQKWNHGPIIIIMSSRCRSFTADAVSPVCRFQWKTTTSPFDRHTAIISHFSPACQPHHYVDDARLPHYLRQAFSIASVLGSGYPIHTFYIIIIIAHLYFRFERAISSFYLCLFAVCFRFSFIRFRIIFRRFVLFFLLLSLVRCVMTTVDRRPYLITLLLWMQSTVCLCILFILLRLWLSYRRFGPCATDDCAVLNNGAKRILCRFAKTSSIIHRFARPSIHPSVRSFIICIYLMCAHRTEQQRRKMSLETKVVFRRFTFCLWREWVPGPGPQNQQAKEKWKMKMRRRQKKVNIERWRNHGARTSVPLD